MIISIKNLSLYSIIGIEKHERTEPRPIIVNVQMRVDALAAAAEDDIDKAVDYADIAERIEAFVSDSSFHLIETLASAILKVIMTDPRIEWASVEVDKPAALESSESVSVSVSSGE